MAEFGQWVLTYGPHLGAVGLLLVFIVVSATALNREWIVLGSRFRETKASLAEVTLALKAANASLEKANREREEARVQMTRLEAERDVIWQRYGGSRQLAKEDEPA